jgi:hypothetical protein
METKVANVEWELFCDEVFFDMWAVRPKGDNALNSPRLFHFALEQDAISFKELIEKAHISIPNE